MNPQNIPQNLGPVPQPQPVSGQVPATGQPTQPANGQVYAVPPQPAPGASFQIPQQQFAPSTQPLAPGPQQFAPSSQPLAPSNFAPPTPGTVTAIPGQAAPLPVPTMTPKKQANTTQNALQLAEIRDGIVIMNDGSYRSVVMAKSINFDLMSPEEREAVEFAYQGFLNSLYFPVQILIHSTRIDIRPYLEKLDKQRLELDNMLLALLMDDYINFIADLSEQTNLMDKKFFVVIPYYPPVTTQAVMKGGKKLFGNIFNAFKQSAARPVITIDDLTLEKAKTELRNRVQAVVSGLMQVSVQSAALDTKELGELFYNTYNPDTATQQKLIDMSELTASVIKKGEGYANNPNLDVGMN
jgi:hypothetical protein